MRAAALTALFCLLLSACGPAHEWARHGVIGGQVQLVALAIDTAVQAATDTPPPATPFCDPVFGVCPDQVAAAPR